MQERERILQEFSTSYANEAGEIDDKKQKFQAVLDSAFAIEFNSEEHKTFIQQVNQILHNSLYAEGLRSDTVELREGYTQAKVDLTKQTVELFKNFINNNKASILADTNKQKTIVRIGGGALLWKNLTSIERMRTFFANDCNLVMEFDEDNIDPAHGGTYEKLLKIFDTFTDYQKATFIRHLIKEKKLNCMLFSLATTTFRDFNKHFCSALSDTSILRSYTIQEFKNLYIEVSTRLSSETELFFTALGHIARFIHITYQHNNQAIQEENTMKVREYLSFIQREFVNFSEAEKESFLKFKIPNVGMSMYYCVAGLSTFVGDFNYLINITRPFTDEEMKKLNRHVDALFNSVTNIIDKYFSSFQRQWTNSNFPKFAASTAICSIAIYAAFNHYCDVKGGEAIYAMLSFEAGVAVNFIAHELLKPRASEYGLQRFYLN